MSPGRFTLVSHLLWALWSVQRAEATFTYDEFDFIHYGKHRMDCYLRTKASLLAKVSSTLVLEFECRQDLAEEKGEQLQPIQQAVAAPG